MESSQGGGAGRWRTIREEGLEGGEQRKEGLEDREQREEGLKDGEQSGRRGWRVESCQGGGAAGQRAEGRGGWRRGAVREELRFVVIEASGVRVHSESEGGRNNNQKYTRVRRKNQFSKNRCFSSTELYL